MAMKYKSWRVRSLLFGATLTFVSTAINNASAQDSSLLLVPAEPPGPGQLTLENSSFMYRRLPAEAEIRELQLNDIIKVLVDYRSAMVTEGDGNSRKTLNFNAILADWIKFDGKNLIPSPQSNGDPSINASLNSQFRTQADMEMRDSLTFAIAAKVADIRPNGNLVIEARRDIEANGERWQQCLTGEVRRQSIGPDRTVRSDEIADLQIRKLSNGFIKDSYTRGWFAKWYGHWKPF